MNGVYTYRLTGCYHERTYIGAAREWEFVRICEPVGDPLAVTVTGPEPDPVARQLADTWQARVGDLGGDGRKDLHLKRTSASAGGGLLSDVILRQTPDGGFEAVPAPPGSANAGRAAPWPVAAAVDLVAGDINLDGFADIEQQAEMVRDCYRLSNNLLVGNSNNSGATYQALNGIIDLQ